MTFGDRPEFGGAARIRAIVDRADRWLGEIDLDQLRGNSSKPGLIAPTEVIGPTVDELPARLARARAKLSSGGRPAEADLAALEAAIRVMRPSLPVTGESVGGLEGEVASRYPTWQQFRRRIRPFLRGVARLDGAASGTPDGAFGSGFLVGENLLVTNRHVVDKLEEDVGPVTKGSWFARFGVESAPEPRRRRVAVTRVVAKDRGADLALLRVSRTFGRPLRLSTAAADQRATVAAVGYPSRDPSAPGFVDELFDHRYGVERVSPGEILTTSATGFLHDCSTMGGSSGSPTVDLTSGAVVGVHAGGDFLISNWAVGVEELRSLIAEHS